MGVLIFLAPNHRADTMNIGDTSPTAIKPKTVLAPQQSVAIRIKK
jgi:hypothetical protein